MVVGPQASVAEAEPSARPISLADGLQPRDVVVPFAVIDGAALSDVHVTVRDAVDVLPHASLAVHDLVCEREQPLLVTEPSETENVGAPQASEADALPNARPISFGDGLQPNVVVVPPVEIEGAVLSSVQLICCTHEVMLPQSSLAIHVLFIVLEQPLLCIGPSDATGITVPSQLSEAVAPLGP